MRISDWSSDVCSSDLYRIDNGASFAGVGVIAVIVGARVVMVGVHASSRDSSNGLTLSNLSRSEEHTSELQSLMRISYAVFCLKKKNKHYNRHPSKDANQDM